MSANSNKKLTERQLAEQKEAKQVKLMTVGFAVVMAVIVVVALWVGISNAVKVSGYPQRNTVAMTVGEHKVSNAELNYYFMDSVNSFYQNYSSYIAMFGIDATKPLDQQYYNEESGETWADNFMAEAKNTVQSTYAMVDAANAEGFTLTAEEMEQISSIKSTLDTYGKLYGLKDGTAYLKAMYGSGADMDSFLNYQQNNQLASSYYNHHESSLTFTDAEIADYASTDDHGKNYVSYSYNQYYLPISKYLPEDVTTSDATEEQTAAAVAAAEADAKALVENSTTVEELDAAIAALEINKDTEASSTVFTDTRYPSMNSTVRDWVVDNRAVGDVTYLASTTGETVNGYYVVMYVGFNDNQFALKNVRHILVKFPTTGEDGTTTDEDKATAKASAEELLAQWNAGDKTEESFAALATEKTEDTGSAANGGLYENVYPGQMVADFEAWCYDAARKPGDTGIVESTYGYHVMYFVGNADLTYFNYLAQQDMRSEAMDTWYQDTLAAETVTDGEIKYINTGLVLSNR